MKTSKAQRKYLNSMRGMSDIPWPARRFKYPATLGVSASEHVGNCGRPIAERQVRSGKLRRKRTEQIACGGKVFLKRGSLGKRRVYCETCRDRKKQRQLNQRLEQRLSRFGTLTPREQIREERRTAKLLTRFRRAGAR